MHGKYNKRGVGKSQNVCPILKYGYIPTLAAIPLPAQGRFPQKTANYLLLVEKRLTHTKKVFTLRNFLSTFADHPLHLSTFSKINNIFSSSSIFNYFLIFSRPEQQGWTSLNKNPSWSWSFFAPIILLELELELLGSNICYQGYSFCAFGLLGSEIFHRA